MSARAFSPTKEQARVIDHIGSAFVTACPGAGKTRVMVERARCVSKELRRDRGVAFLSFTRGAIQELADRLRREALLPSPAFPHFVGTFDSFIWQFFVAPFGIPGVEAPPRLIPDKGKLRIKPFEKAQPLPLSCFDRHGQIIPARAKRESFDLNEKRASAIKSYETAARRLLERMRLQGELDFDDARELAVTRLQEQGLAKRLAGAIAGRFRELIVDEAQDCNAADLYIIGWLRDAGIHTKVVCDPEQAIYEFRGGITDDITRFGEAFETKLGLSGNFRSTENICKAICSLRGPINRGLPDEPFGEYAGENLPIHILAYAGRSVPPGIGEKFAEILSKFKIDTSSAPILAATKKSGCNAAGRPLMEAREDLTFRLAESVSDFFSAYEPTSQISAMEELHQIILRLEGALTGADITYHQYLVAHGIKPSEWRPRVLGNMRALKYDPQVFADADAWHRHAKALLEPLIPVGTPSIAKRLPRNASIPSVLALPLSGALQPKTIHSVKGSEFTAACVVTTPQTFKSILNYLEAGVPLKEAEPARELYVAASRAQRLLAFAAPRSQSTRFLNYLQGAGVKVVMLDV